MAKENQSLRRRAAVAVLSNVLDEDSLLTELWSLQTSLRGDSANDVIECVDGLATRHLFDVGTRKRLYTEFFKALRTPEDSLPLDPWPAMQAVRPPIAAVPPPAVAAAAPMPNLAPAMAWSQPRPFVPVAVPQPVPVAVAPIAVAQSDALNLQPDAAPPAAPTVPEAPIVFGAVMRAMVAELSRSHGDALDEVHKDAMRALAGSRAPADLREQYGRAWDRAQSHDWKLYGAAEDLASMLQLTHSALVMAFGRVGADQIVGRALNDAERLPEAVRFSPRRLMSRSAAAN